jgi:hypothetical protein
MGAGGATTADLGGGPPAAHKPIPLYGVTLEALMEGSDRALSGAQRFGWRYLVVDRGEDALVDLIDRDEGAPHVFAVARGAGEELARTGLRAETESSEQDFEARLLDLSAIGMTVLWLHSHHQPDRFYVISADQDQPSWNEAELMAEASRRARAKRRVSGHEGEGDDVGG